MRFRTWESLVMFWKCSSVKTQSGCFRDSRNKLLPRVLENSAGRPPMKLCLCVSIVILLALPLFAQQSVPEISFDSAPDFFKLPPGMNFGEVPGVAVDSKGNIYVFTRSNTATGPAYAPAAAQLLEFNPKGDFLREIGKGLYGWSEAHTVRIDKNDNIWAIDKGSDMIIMFNQARRVKMVFGRRKESADEDSKPWKHVNPPLPAVNGLFRQPTDVAWDAEGNIYITDGYINSRVAKYDKNGDWVKSWGSKGTGPGQFDMLDQQNLPQIKMPIGDNYAPLPDWKPRTKRLPGYPY